MYHFSFKNIFKNLRFEENSRNFNLNKKISNTTIPKVLVCKGVNTISLKCIFVGAVGSLECLVVPELRGCHRKRKRHMYHVPLRAGAF